MNPCPAPPAERYFSQRLRSIETTNLLTRAASVSVFLSEFIRPRDRRFVLCFIIFIRHGNLACISHSAEPGGSTRDSDRLNVSSELVSLSPIRAVLVFKASAFKNRERNHQVRAGLVANHKPVRLPVTRHALAPVATFAEICAADRRAVFHIQFAHDNSFLSGASGSYGRGIGGCGLLRRPGPLDNLSLRTRQDSNLHLRLTKRSIRNLRHRPWWLFWHCRSQRCHRERLMTGEHAAAEL